MPDDQVLVNPDITSESAHSFVYGQGGCSLKGLGAMIVKSPYMRRLQAIRYFSDLAWILETTYEQHVLGTACYMKMYPKTISRIRSNLFEKYLAALVRDEGDSKLPMDTMKLFRTVHTSYEARLSEVGPLPTLMGMLAAPPYRRPFGTSTKRLYIRTLNKILWESLYRPTLLKHLGIENAERGRSDDDPMRKEITENLNTFRDCIIEFFTGIYKNRVRVCSKTPQQSKHPIKKLEKVQLRITKARTGLLEPLRQVIDWADLKLVEDEQNPDKQIDIGPETIENQYKNYLIEIIKNYFREIIPSENDITKTSSREFIKQVLPYFWLTGSFLLRYRVLGTLLASGYIIYNLLNIIKNDLNSEKINIVKILDYYIRLADSMLVNFQTSLIMPREIQIFNNKNKSFYTIYHTPAGAKDLALLKPYYISLKYNDVVKLFKEILLEFFNVSEEKLNIYIDQNQNVKTIIERIIKNIPILVLINSNDNIIKINKCTNYYCIISGPFKYKDKAPSPLFLYLGSIKEPFYRNRDIYCCILEALDTVNPTSPGKHSQRLEKLLRSLHHDVVLAVASGTALLLMHPRRGINRNKFSPYLTYFDVNLVQSDMVPSSYQLDLLARLLKDIGLGVSVKPSYLWDVALNLDTYSVLTLDTLNTIYSFLFKDPAVIAMRAGLLLRGNSENPHFARLAEEILGGNAKASLASSDLLAVIYYMSLAEELERISEEIKKTANMILRITQEKKRARRTQGKVFNNYLDSIEALTIIGWNLAHALYAASKILTNITIYLLRDTLGKAAKDRKPGRDRLERLARSLAGCRGLIENPETQSSAKASPLRESSPFQTLRDWSISSCLGFYHTEKTAGDMLLVHGIIPITEIYLALETFNNNLKGFFNMVGLIVLSHLQNTMQKEVEQLIKKELEKHGIEAELVLITIPGQGVIKPYFHLPIAIANAPQIIDSITYKSIKQIISSILNNNEYKEYFYILKKIYKGIIDNKITKKHIELHDIIRNKILEIIEINNKQIKYIDKSIIEHAPTLYANPQIKILSDPLYWNAISIQAREEDYLQYSVQDPKTTPRLSFFKSNIIYAIILKNNKIINNITLEKVQSIIKSVFIKIIEKYIK